MFAESATTYTKHSLDATLGFKAISAGIALTSILQPGRISSTFATEQLESRPQAANAGTLLPKTPELDLELELELVSTLACW